MRYYLGMCLVIVFTSGCCDCFWNKEERDLTKKEIATQENSDETTKQENEQAVSTTLSLLQGNWDIKEMNEIDVSSAGASLKFVDQKVVVKSGCNTMVEIICSQGEKDNQVYFDKSRAQSTMIGCPADHIENDLFKLIGHLQYCEIKGEQLVLRSDTRESLVLMKEKF